jgi:carbon storage regulator
MLVLSRRQSETIVIADNIRVQVLEISGGRVRLAIEAPEHVSIDREEIWKRKQLERRALREPVGAAGGEAASSRFMVAAH